MDGGRVMRGLLLFSLLILSACALLIPPECRYLKAAQHHATMADVQERLGVPLMRNDTPNGTTWLYEVLEEQPTHRGTPTGFWCDEYVLTFDQQGVLRHWEHKSQKHRDPPSPTNCVTNGFMSQASSFNWQYRLTRW